jgi:hypothetical protein
VRALNLVRDPPVILVDERASATPHVRGSKVERLGDSHLVRALNLVRDPLTVILVDERASATPHVRGSKVERLEDSCPMRYLSLAQAVVAAQPSGADLWWYGGVQRGR